MAEERVLGQERHSGPCLVEVLHDADRLRHDMAIGDHRGHRVAWVELDVLGVVLAMVFLIS